MMTGTYGRAAMNTLERIIAHGNRLFERGENGLPSFITPDIDNEIVCADGFTLSVLAGPLCYCSPSKYDGLDRPGVDEYTLRGPYTHVEVGFPSERPEPWETWAVHCHDEDQPTDTVYGMVPVDVVRALVAAHGGEVS